MEAGCMLRLCELHKWRQEGGERVCRPWDLQKSRRYAWGLLMLAWCDTDDSGHKINLKYIQKSYLQNFFKEGTNVFWWKKIFELKTNYLSSLLLKSLTHYTCENCKPGAPNTFCKYKDFFGKHFKGQILK